MNNTIFYFFYNFSHQSQILDKVIIFFAVYFPYVVIILAGLFLLFHHEVFQAENPYRVFLQKKKEILLTFFSGCLAYVLAYVVKFLFHTPRPFDLFPPSHSLTPLISESGYSFPSGHATFFMALAIALFIEHKKAGYIFMLFALIIGIARVTAGVHFPVDILGGFILGGITSYLVAFFVKSV